MARWGGIPKIFGRVHPKHQTPDVSTIVFGAVSTIWFVVIDILSPNNVLGDSVDAVGFMVCLYYGLTGFACTWYFRRELFKSARNFFFVGLAPLLGGLSLLGVFIIGMSYYGHQINNYSKDILGLGLPDVIAIGLIIIGLDPRRDLPLHAAGVLQPQIGDRQARRAWRGRQRWRAARSCRMVA